MGDIKGFIISIAKVCIVFDPILGLQISVPFFLELLHKQKQCRVLHPAFLTAQLADVNIARLRYQVS